MGVKAGIEPLALWEAIRQGATGRQRTFDRLGGQFLQGRYEPPDFALRLLHKDVSLALQLGREVSVPVTPFQIQTVLVKYPAPSQRYLSGISKR